MSDDKTVRLNQDDLSVKLGARIYLTKESAPSDAVFLGGAWFSPDDLLCNCQPAHPSFVSPVHELRSHEGAPDQDAVRA